VRKLLIALILIFSYINANEYSEGFKLYKKAKHKLRNGDVKTAKSLFLQAKTNFEIADSKGSTQAELKLAALYCHGWGVNKDKQKAKMYLNKAQSQIANLNVFDKCLKNLKGE